MRKYVFPTSIVLNIILLLTILFPSLTSIISDPPEKNQTSARVLRVIDGDTFDIENDVRIRLAGANAPEETECLGLAAKERLEELVIGKEVRLKEKEIGKFKRTIAFVYLEDLFIDQILIEEGLAVTETSAKNHPQYGPILTGSEERAQKSKRGIWSSKCTSPPDPACIIKGNYRKDKDTKIYHTPDCFNYKKIILKENENDKWFCSEKEALEEGFRKSLDCPK